MLHLVADLHTHSIASGHAYSTIDENIRWAREQGLEMVAITDHGPCLPGSPDLSYFGNFHAVPRHWQGVEVLLGVEANILDCQGSLDVPPQYLNKLDIVLAGLHYPCYQGGSTEENTRALVAALANPWVDILVHPGNPRFPIDPQPVVAAAARHGVALEINSASLGSGSLRRGSEHCCREIVRLAACQGVLVSVGSDAHFLNRVGDLKASVELLMEGGIDSGQVLNTSRERVHCYLQQRREKRPPVEPPR